MSSAALALPLNFTHRLAVAFQFVDIFTLNPVPSPLEVSIPSERWTAFASESDHTYRLLATNRDVPAGVFTVQVDSPSGEYAALEAISITLPVVVGHPPPVVRADFLITQPLWPTRLTRPAPGETAVVGRIASGGVTPLDGLRMFVFTGGVAPATPYAYANELGEFLFRLPLAKTSFSGVSVTTHALFNVECLDSTNAVVPIVPASIDLVFGRSHDIGFSVP